MIESNETNQADAVDVIMSRSRDKLRPLYRRYHGAYGHQTLQDANLPCWALAYKVA